MSSRSSIGRTELAYDVIGVNVFLLTLMRFLLKKEVNSVRPILLTMNRKRGLKDSTNHAKRKAFPIIMRVVNDNDCQ